MWLAVKVVSVFVVILGIGIVVLWQKAFAPGPVPQLREEWWGPGTPQTVPTTITPFEIKFSEPMIQDLQRRLDNWTPTPPITKNFSYGVNNDHFKSVISYWRNKYDFRQREKYLNTYPQFKTNIAGLNIHFIHVKPKNVAKDTKVVPLLLLHGWPGSVREFYKIIDILTTKKGLEKSYNFAFEVVVPSLPGYGFSDAAAKPGLGPAQMAVIMRQLMQRLGHQQFYVQGGDWGSLIVTNMATFFPNNVLGMHANMCFTMHPLAPIITWIGSLYPLLLVDPPYQSRVYPMSKIYSNLLEETGYLHLQATKPDTLGSALRDSPAGLAAYILEKFSTWTDKNFKSLNDGGLTKKFTLDELLDNVMIYWVSGSITTSIRLYSEAFCSAQMSLGLDKIPVNVPTACGAAPYELAYQPRAILLLKYPQLIQYTHYERGGHFLAFEEPMLLANDVYSAVHKMMSA